MRFLLIVCFVFIFGNLLAQSNTEIISEIENYRASENEKFGAAETTILTSEDFENFTTLEYYPIDLKYRVTATFLRTPNEKPFLMPTTTDRLPEYVKYGEAHFQIDDTTYKLALYKSTNAWGNPEKYGNHLFLPFTDVTNSEGSYGGGRYLDLIIPNGNEIVIDFNKSYNPYCAYNPKYSCPIPPLENDLSVRIEAGIKDPKKY